jgi:hypothetical protein
MKKILGTGAVTLVMLAAMMVPASAHIEVGVNCHFNDVSTRSGERVHIEIRITNRSDETHRNACEVKIRTNTHHLFKTSVCNLPPNTFCVRSYTVHIPGEFRFARIIHGHVL